MQPGATPNWIFPVIPSANNSVFNAFTFIYEMWRPLYWTVNGVTPEIVPNMSIANPTTWSNGNKTVTISLKSSYKWSNGQPITANDVLFDIDLIKAAVKASPANWADLRAGPLPGQPGQHLRAELLDAGAEPQRPGQPDVVHH